jgi:hypothetical protein
MRPSARVLIAAVLLGVLPAASSSQDAPGPATTRPAPEAEPPSSNLDFWLRRAHETPTTTAPAPEGIDPFARSRTKHPASAVPGVLELSDGRRIPGWLHTTGGGPLLVYVEGEKRWRRIPPAAALSVTALTVEQTTKPDWRWQAMGQPERVYTGQSRVATRLLWRVRLADGGEIVGTVKGQPIHMTRDGERVGPFVLHERLRGKPGQKPEDLVYVRRIVFSRRLMEQMTAKTSEETPKP